METLTILLPDQIRRLVSDEAHNRGVDPSALCSGIIAEHFLIKPDSKTSAENPGPSVHTSTSHSAQIGVATGLDVSRHFARYPGLSLRLAQKFVDAALRIPGTRAFATPRGVGFEPNFVFILYLRKKQPGGIGVSFYGAPEQHHYAGLRTGRNPNYSSSIVESMDDLEKIIPDIRRAHELRFH